MNGRIFILGLVGILVSGHALRAASGSGDLEVTLEKDPPAISGGVSHVQTTSAKGMAWRWNAANGRRDYGELFRASQAFSAEEFAVQVLFSDPFRTSLRMRFEVVFLRFASGSLSGGMDAIATFSGVLPSNPEIPRDQSAWLKMKFAPVAFSAGETYGVLLRFLEERKEGQNIVLVVLPANTPDGGYGLQSADGQRLEKAPSLNFLLGKSPGSAKKRDPVEPRVLVVDRRGSGPYRTIAAAVAEAKAGDTIQLAPGSGPYRETVFIAKSGEAGLPITLDGSGETVTGFEPLVFQKQGDKWVVDLRSFFAAAPRIQGFTKKDGRWTSPVPNAFPSVLTYRGQRVLQDAKSGQFTEYVTVSEEGTQLALLPGVSPEGWEISSRDAVVKILDASHHVYKNVKATGSLNDGFNLHGKGTDLVFQNVEGFQNLDEGFSAHDDIECVIENGRFHQNDNGVGNVARSVMKGSRIEVYGNTGYGLWLLHCRADLDGVKAWGNGVAQIAFQGNSIVTLQNVSAARPAWSTKPWLSYEESATRNDSLFYEVVSTVKCTGVVAEMTENPVASAP